MEGIELSHRKRTFGSPTGSQSSDENKSFLPISNSAWAESAASDGPIFISNQLASANPYEQYTDHEKSTPEPNDEGLESLSFNQLKPVDRNNFFVLVFLYLLQGIPVGLAFGSIPFLLKSRLSYGQVGIFTLASYPYSLKLLWSPIVDAFYHKTFGRRKSWIVPIQTISAIVLLYLGTSVERLLENAQENLFAITVSFFTLVFLCATQDIAVDGWALTLLTPEALSYASTAQTVGLNTGYFMSFTVFLAFNSPEFANKYFRSVPSDVPFLTLSQYLIAWGWIYLVATVVLGLLKKEERTRSDSGGILAVYKSMYNVLKLNNIQILIMVHLVAKIGFQANEAVTNLKLLEKGFSKEDLALTVLIDFPFEIIFGYYAAKWSTGTRPLKPWMLGYIGRLVCAVISMMAVIGFPKNEKIGFGYLLIIICTHVLGSFMSTIQFVSINAFHTQIADPSIGGTYMTTLNTISNLGGQWPRLIVLFAVDWFTKATCEVSNTSSLGSGSEKTFAPFSCAKEADKAHCRELGGICNVETDGYYVSNVLCVLVGLALFFFWIRKKMMHLESLPKSAWRVDSY